MATFTTNAAFSNSSNANFQAWINEIYNALVTQCGLTQTADTGQMAVPSVSAVPGAANTSAGYYVFRFNDTLQSTSPIFLKMEFGCGTATTDPMIWVTVGTGSNGSGTINGGSIAARTVIGPGGNAPASTYNSYFCYNATQGVLWMVYKIGAGTVNAALANSSFGIWRSVNSAGAPTADCVQFAGGLGAVVAGGNSPQTTIYNYNTSATQVAATSINATPGQFGCVPLSETSTLESGTGQVFPVWQYKGSSTVPGAGITNSFAIGVLAEIPTQTTLSLNLLGALSMTYICLPGGPFSGGGTGTSMSFGYSFATFGVLCLWQ